MDKKAVQDTGRLDMRRNIIYLIDIYKESVYKLCYQLTKNRFEAEDLFQETWMRVVGNFNLYDDSRSFKTWLYTITTNLYKDRYRKQKRWLSRIKDFFTNEFKDSELSKVENFDFDPETVILDKELTDKLEMYVNSLDDIFRIPVIFYYYKEMSYDEISQVLDIPIGTVKSRISRGIRKLQVKMGGDDYED